MTKTGKKTMKTMLDKAINGREVITYVDGLYAPHNKNSNLYKAIIAAGYTPDDIGGKIAIAIGAHRRHGPDGWKMAIVKLPQEKEPAE